MKIGIIAHNGFPICEPFQGGLEMFTYLLVNELVNRNHEVSTLCKKGSTFNCKMIYYSELEQHSDGEYSASLHEFEQFYSSVSEFLIKDFDIIHNNSISHHAIVLGSLITLPFITTFHCTIFDNIRAAIGAVNKQPNQVFTTVSNHLKVDFQEHLENVSTVYNGIDLSTWSISTTKENYYSWCGRICKEKGLLEIMDLCAANQLTLKIAGPIFDNVYFEEFIKPRLEKNNNFEYSGHLKQREVNKLISKSKAFLFSSIWQEPYGMVIAEALASGTPVIANNIGAAPEILTDTCGILFDINNPESFESAISKLDEISPSDCRERAENFCCHLKMVDNYEQIYFQLATARL